MYKSVSMIIKSVGKKARGIAAHWLPICLCAILSLLASCSESDDTPEEYPDWKNYNETFVQHLATDSIARGWERIKNFSYTAGEGQAHEYIYVKRVRNGQGTVRPIYTDSVLVHYQGRLLPSTTYSTGYIFDQSWMRGTQLDEDINTPVKFNVSGVVDGFSTALQNMVEGDRWIVYIPYQLGYGSSEVASISGTNYSTMRFDITLSKVISGK